MIRAARPEDLPRVLEQCDPRYSRFYQEKWPCLGSWFQTLLSDDGYVTLCVGLIEGLTNEPQAQIYELRARSEEGQRALLEAAEDLARSHGASFLVAQLAPDEEASCYQQAGYAVDIHRIARPLGVERPADGRYRIRPATKADRLFILWLIRHTSPNTVPAGRTISAPQMVDTYFRSYQSTDFAGDPELRTLIADHPEKPRQVGYLVVRLGLCEEPDPTPFAYVYDIAVHPDHWGRRVPHQLIRAADPMLRAEGFTTLVGDVSQANPRALKTGLKSLSFQTRSRRWAKNLEAR